MWVQAGFVYQLAQPPDFGGRPVLLGSDQLPDGFHDATAGAGVEPFQHNVPAGNASNDAPKRPRLQIPGLGGGAGAVHRNPPTGQPGQNCQPSYPSHLTKAGHYPIPARQGRNQFGGRFPTTAQPATWKTATAIKGNPQMRQRAQEFIGRVERDNGRLSDPQEIASLQAALAELQARSVNGLTAQEREDMESLEETLSILQPPIQPKALGGLSWNLWKKPSPSCRIPRRWEPCLKGTATT